MKRRNILALFVVLLLVITSVISPVSAHAEELDGEFIMTEESATQESEEVPYIIAVETEVPDEEDGTIYAVPEEFNGMDPSIVAPPEEFYNTPTQEEIDDTNNSQVITSHDYNSYTYVITSEGVEVNVTSKDGEKSSSYWSSEGTGLSQQDLINDVDNFLKDNGEFATYTPDYEKLKKQLESEAIGPKEYDPNNFELVIPSEKEDSKNRSDMVEGEYEGINWVYDPVEKKLTFTPGTSTIIPYVSKDDYSTLPWMKYKNVVEKISVQDGITSIYANNFRDFTKLNKVYTSGAVNQISSYAFTGCDNIKQFIINCYELDWSFDSDLLFNISNDPLFICNYSTDKNSTFHKLYYEGRYDLNTNQMNSANMEDVEVINQVDNEIYYYHTDAHPVLWEDTACVASSYSMLVERYAANNGYESLSGSYDKNTGIELVKEVSNNGGPGHVLNADWDWVYNTFTETYSFFVKDNNDLSVTTANITSFNAVNGSDSQDAESKLKEMLKSHPEGIVVYTNYKDINGKSINHAVLVTNYSNGKYTIFDPNGGKKRTTSEYTNIFNGFEKPKNYSYDHTISLVYIVR